MREREREGAALPKVCMLDKVTLYSSLSSGAASSRSFRVMVSFSSFCGGDTQNTQLLVEIPNDSCTSQSSLVNMISLCS